MGDVSHFVPAYTHADDIPARKLTAAELGLPEPKARGDQYVMLPLSSLGDIQPASRLAMAVHFALRVYGQDAPGGWVVLTRSLARRFDLDGKSVRSRAIRAAERAGRVEVDRHSGRSVRLRLKHPPKDLKKPRNSLGFGK